MGTQKATQGAVRLWLRLLCINRKCDTSRATKKEAWRREAMRGRSQTQSNRIPLSPVTRLKETGQKVSPVYWESNVLSSRGEPAVG